MNETKSTGMPCPKCGVFIPTNMYMILHSRAVDCPACGLHLTINQQASEHALSILQKVEDAQRDVEDKSHFRR